MSEPPSDGVKDGPRLAALRAGGGQLAGWGMVAAVGAVALALGDAGGGARVRLLCVGVGVGQLVFAGAVSAALAAAWEAWGPRALQKSLAAVGGAGLAVGAFVLPADLQGAVRSLPVPRAAGIAALVVAASAAIVALALAGRALAATRASRGAAAALGAGLAAAGHLVLVGDYPGVHLFLAWGAAVLAGSAFAVGRPPRRGGAIAVAAAAILSAPAALVHVPNAVAVEMMRGSGAVLAPWLRRARVSVGRGRVPLEQRAWFSDRSSLPDVPPGAPPLLPRDGIVLLLTIDALRADVVAGDGHAEKLPTLTALRRGSVAFTAARAPASSTTASMASLFTGRYYGSLFWTPSDTEPTRITLRDDPSPRFNELLSKGGVRTLNVTGLPGQASAFGILRGFDEDVFVPAPKGFAGADLLLPALLARLQAPREGPLFACVHMDDAHAPYGHGGAKGTNFQRYLIDLARVDAALGRLLDGLAAAGLGDRTTIVLSADHGEAFGEHGTYYHAVSVYEEQLRVPLFVRVPAVAPRTVTTPVSLLDLGPTVLDLFGVSTPATFMGQSLTGFLRDGPPPALTRPLAAESSRRAKAMLFPDGQKAIVDPVNGTVELYDLVRDPGERENLADDPGFSARAGERLDTLLTFFEAQRLRRPGYEAPYFAH